MTLPVLLFPLDETLSPAKFAHEPIPPLALVMGLTGAGFVTPPIIVPIVLVAANLGILLGSQGLVLAVLASVALLMILVMSTQLFSATVTSILRTRYGRDLIFLVIGGLGFAIFFIQQQIAQTVGDLGLTATVLEFPLSPVTWLIPPVAAQQAIVQASQGNALAAVGALGAACVWIVVIGWVWLKVINWITTTPEAPEREKLNLECRSPPRISMVNGRCGGCKRAALLQTRPSHAHGVDRRRRVLGDHLSLTGGRFHATRDHPQYSSHHADCAGRGPVRRSPYRPQPVRLGTQRRLVPIRSPGDR